MKETGAKATWATMTEADQRIAHALARRLGIENLSGTVQFALRHTALAYGVLGPEALDFGGGAEERGSAVVGGVGEFQPKEPQPQKEPKKGWGFAVTRKYRSWTGRKPSGYWMEGGAGYIVATDASLTPDEAAQKLVAEGNGYGEPADLLATRVAWVRKYRLNMKVPNFSAFMQRYNQAK